MRPASSECPPRPTKSSCTPTRSIPSAAAQTPQISRSSSVRGATYPSPPPVSASSATAAANPPSSSRRRSAARWILPASVRGMSPRCTRSTRAAAAPKREATTRRTSRRSASRSAAPVKAVCRKTAAASVSRPGVRTAQTAVQPRTTPSTSSTAASTSWLWMLSPLTIRTSFSRPVSVSAPPRRKPASPVSNQPSSVKLSRVSSGSRAYPGVTVSPRTWMRPRSPSAATDPSASTTRSEMPGIRRARLDECVVIARVQRQRGKPREPARLRHGIGGAQRFRAKAVARHALHEGVRRCARPPARRSP